MEFKGTKGNWSIPHICREDIKCDCAFVLSEMYCGSIATIDYSLTRDIKDGDNPPIEEAKYNALLISKAPEILDMLHRCKIAFDNLNQPFISSDIDKLIKEATEL